MLVAGLPVLSKKYYTENEFTESSIKKPVGSGTYTIGSYSPGNNVTFERVEDYWAEDLPVNVGRNNFDEIRFEYFRDRSAAFEAFKAGAYLFNEEFTSQFWATAYTPESFPADRHGRREARDPARQPAGRHSGLLVQPAPREVPGPARARGDRAGLRFRMVEREAVL